MVVGRDRLVCFSERLLDLLVALVLSLYGRALFVARVQVVEVLEEWVHGKMGRFGFQDSGHVFVVVLKPALIRSMLLIFSLLVHVDDLPLVEGPHDALHFFRVGHEDLRELNGALSAAGLAENHGHLVVAVSAAHVELPQAGVSELWVLRLALLVVIEKIVRVLLEVLLVEAPQTDHLVGQVPKHHIYNVELAIARAGTFLGG